jgi:LEA14-like dessication related protein
MGGSWWLASLGCTPLGLWLYQDPALEVSRVRLGAEHSAGDRLMVALDVRNPNDYALATARVELRLRLDDVAIGEFERDSILAVPQDGISTVTLPLTPGKAATPERLRLLQSGTHKFLVEGRATFTTPIGKRKVRFAQEGSMAFGQPPSSASAGTIGPSSAAKLIVAQ